MKQAIYGGDDDGGEEEPNDQDVEELQALMLKMQAVRGKLLYPLKSCADEYRLGSRYA